MSQTLPKLSHPLVDEAQYDLLRSVGYLGAADRRDIIDACKFGDIAHIKDKRKSGEPYITHPIAVAEILAGFRLDRDSIIARLRMIPSKIRMLVMMKSNSAMVKLSPHWSMV